jgi:transcriptional regulator with XRE-family HTH domain
MPSVGLELKQARERLGLSTAQIEERTKVQTYKIEALENGDVAKLPDGIYLDGIIRAYAHEVGLDPEPLIEQSRAERENADWETSFGDLDTIFRDEHADESRTPPHIEPVTALPSSQRSVPAASPRDDSALDEDTGFHSLRAERHSSRAAEIEIAAARARLRPFGSAQQRSRLTLSLVVLIAIAGWGAYFYEVSRRSARDETSVVAAPSPAPSGVVKDSEAVAPGNVPSASPDQRPGLDANARAGTRESAATAGTTAPPAPSRTDAPPKLPSAIPPAETAPPLATAPVTGSAATAPARDVSGGWRLATRVESSNVPNFTGLNLGFDIQLKQAGNRITGSGRKVTENGAEISAQAQTPISLAGTIAGDRLTLTFTESGAQRPTQGKFVLLLEDGGTLRGRFTSTAAQSSGTVVAQRVEQP